MKRTLLSLAGIAAALLTLLYLPEAAAVMAAVVQAPALDPAVVLSATMAPSVITRAVGEAYERKSGTSGADDDSAPALAEVKRTLETLGRAWETYKQTNDELIKAKADGKVIGDLQAKMDKISADLDKLGDVKGEFDALMLRLQRPGGAGGSKGEDTLDTECKAFNMAMAADFQSKGKPIPAAVTVDQFAQYKSAFFNICKHGNLELLSSDERKAMSVGSDPDGGYLMPPATAGRMVKRVFEKSVMRQVATIVPLSGDSLEGIVDHGENDAGWVSEMGARNDTNNAQVKKYRIEAHEMYAQPKVTQKLIDDAATDVESWLVEKNADKFARVESLAFWQGAADGKPRGLATYTTAATGDDTREWGVLEHVLSGANGDFHTTKFDPLQDLVGAFKTEFLQNAKWIMRREVRTKARKLKETGTDRYLWEPSLQAGQPDRLLGYPALVDQFMPALATGSLSLAFGDFAEAYTIVDRLGVRTLRDPYTAKPFVRFYSTKRTGGGCINFEAVKFIKFSS